MPMTGRQPSTTGFDQPVGASSKPPAERLVLVSATLKRSDIETLSACF